MDDQYYLRRMSDILQDGCLPRPSFPANPTRLSRHVILGNQQNAENLGELEELKITHVLCCSFTRRSFESPYPPQSNIAYKCLPTEDREDFNISAFFPEAFFFLKSAREKRGRALVHCNMGVNRSGAITAAYLMIDERRFLLDAIAYLEHKRRLVLTNRGFRRQLVAFARDNNLLDPFPTDIPRPVRRMLMRVETEDGAAATSRPRVRRISKKNDLARELSAGYGNVVVDGATKMKIEDKKFEKLGYANENIRPRCFYKENYQLFANRNRPIGISPKSSDPARRKTDCFSLEFIPLIPHKKSLPFSDRETLGDRFEIRQLSGNLKEAMRPSDKNVSNVSKTSPRYSRGSVGCSDRQPIIYRENTRLNSGDDRFVRSTNFEAATLNDSFKDSKRSGPIKEAYFLRPREPAGRTPLPFDNNYKGSVRTNILGGKTSDEPTYRNDVIVGNRKDDYFPGNTTSSGVTSPAIIRRFFVSGNEVSYNDEAKTVRLVKKFIAERRLTGTFPG